MKHCSQFISQLETLMQELGNLKNGQELSFWALFLLFISGPKMLIIKIKI